MNEGLKYHQSDFYAKRLDNGKNNYSTKREKLLKILFLKKNKISSLMNFLIINMVHSVKSTQYVKYRYSKNPTLYKMNLIDQAPGYGDKIIIPKYFFVPRKQNLNS
jgi:hypothetical protein